MSQVDAVRLATQATFGPTMALVDHMTSSDAETWLNEQFAATGSTYADLAKLSVTGNYCDTAPGDFDTCGHYYYWSRPLMMRFYADAVAQPDQLRQRVAFALSQLLVASTTEIDSTASMAAFNQILLTNAFGNYRDILEAVTLSGAMGRYLDLANSSRAAPSENYAREFLQLFTIGPKALNPDGTLKRDASGNTIPNYTPEDIKGVARALTGWTYTHLAATGASESQSRDYASPLIPDPSIYDGGEKTFMGTTVPAGASSKASLEAVIDAAFNNPSAPPLVSKFLIQKLVTDNPTNGYVARVAAAFINNGAGARGDMKAVIRAILMDPEARGGPRTGADDGKVKEPILLMTSLARAVGMSTDGYAFTLRDAALGQQIFRAPSVFNFYPPDYPLPQSATLLSPASKLLSAGAFLQRHNLVYDWTLHSESERWDFIATPAVAGSTGSSLNWTSWQTLSGDVDALLDRVNLLLLANTMTADQRTTLRTALLAYTNSDLQAQARKRAEIAFYIVAGSPQFQVDR